MDATEDQPPRKRARTAGEDIDSAEGIIRSADYWFRDGSVILQAESKQFRVHMTTLSLHSTVFHDMFEMPQPLEGEELVEGCPIVQVSDSSQEIEIMLSLIYTRKVKAEPYEISVISAMLRLGKKYDIEYQYQTALQCLKTEFPATLQGWDAGTSEFTCIVNQPGVLFDCARLAVAMDVLQVLPTIYLNLQGSMTDLSIGRRRGDGSFALIPPFAQQACITGRDMIQKAGPQGTYAWLSANSGNCTSRGQCIRKRIALMQVLWERADPIEFFSPIDDFKPDLESLCKECASSARIQHEAGRQKMWDDLPMYFGLPPWNELLK